jgi:hypothetical protein
MEIQIIKDIVKISTDKKSDFCDLYFDALVELHKTGKVPKFIDHYETPDKLHIKTTCFGDTLPHRLTADFDPFSIIYDVLFFMEEVKKKHEIDIEFPNITYFTLDEKNDWKLNFFKFREDKTLGHQVYNLFLGFFFPATMKKYSEKISAMDDFSSVTALLLEIENDIKKNRNPKSIGCFNVRDPELITEAVIEYKKEYKTCEIFKVLFNIPFISVNYPNPRAIKYSNKLRFSKFMKQVYPNETRYYPVFTDEHYCVTGFPLIE